MKKLFSTLLAANSDKNHPMHAKLVSITYILVIDVFAAAITLFVYSPVVLSHAGQAATSPLDAFVVTTANAANATLALTPAIGLIVFLFISALLTSVTSIAFRARHHVTK